MPRKGVCTIHGEPAVPRKGVCTIHGEPAVRLGALLGRPRFHWVCDQVAVGPYPDRFLLSCLAMDGVRGLLDVSGRNEHHPGRESFQVLKRPLHDGPGNTPRQLSQAAEALDLLLGPGGGVYVHCVAGVNRAPAVAVAWLARGGLPLEAALRELAARHPQTAIHPALLALLQQLYA